MQTTQLEYDLFVSYSQADREWVEGYLLDALASAGLRVISALNFSLGAPQITEFERAIKCSKRTLLVLSPAYVAESILHFVDVIVQSYGLESGTWPVIPLRLKPVELPPRLAFLVALDATQVKSWSAVVTRLCDTLQANHPPLAVRPPCPYPGMRAFQPQEATHFYGRETEVETLLQQLRLYPFVAVLGASGSGKSSLIFAGLIPALQSSTLFGPGNWLVRHLRPGAQPLTTLQATLGSGEFAHFSPAALLAAEPGATRLLLVVDQFEEIFTHGATEQAAFLAAVEHFIALRDCYAVLTVRADFFSNLLTSSLWSLIQGHRLELAPLNASGLRSAIVKPAETVGVFIESALVERLVAGSAGQPGLLPFVQELMVRLWEKLERRFLPLHAYEALVLPLARYSGSERSGIQAAMAQVADEIIQRLTPEQQRFAHRIFLRMVQFGEGRDDARRQQTVSSLHAVGDNVGIFEFTLHYLADQRLLVLSGVEGGDAYVDLAHEAMLTGWPMLQGWIRTYKGSETARRRLETRTDEWVQRGRLQDDLLNPTQVAEAAAWLETATGAGLGCSVTLAEFIGVSRQAIEQLQRRQRRKRVTVWTIVVALTSLSLWIVGGLLYGNWINRAWVTDRAGPEVALAALASNGAELAVGSYHYGVARRATSGWMPLQAGGLPTGTMGANTNEPTATVDAVLWLAYDPLRSADLYGWVDGHGVYRLVRSTNQWQPLGADGPTLTEALLPLAISNGVVLAIGDDPGLHIWQPDGLGWRYQAVPTGSTPQQFLAVTTDSKGVPYLVSDQGVFRGQRSTEWSWQPVSNIQKVALAAIGADNTLMVAINGTTGSGVLCLRADGTVMDKRVPLAPTNWFLQALGQIPITRRTQVTVKTMVADWEKAGVYYAVTNHGAVFALTCTGQRTYLGQIGFWNVARTQLAISNTPAGERWLNWATGAGLRRLPLP